MPENRPLSSKISLIFGFNGMCVGAFSYKADITDFTRWFIQPCKQKPGHNILKRYPQEQIIITSSRSFMAIVTSLNGLPHLRQAHALPRVYCRAKPSGSVFCNVSQTCLSIAALPTQDGRDVPRSFAKWINSCAWNWEISKVVKFSTGVDVSFWF